MNSLAKSKTVNNINIRVGDEVFRFNVGKLLHIDENKIEDEGELSIANFGYFSILKAKVGRRVSDLQLKANTLLSNNFNLAKEDEVTVGRVSDKYAEQQAFEDPEYVSLLEQINQAREQFYILSSIVEALKLKVNIIQTISANQRNS